METAHKVDTVVLDKTGTITEGRPEVTDIVLTGAFNEEEFLKIAAGLESRSEHPLGLTLRLDHEQDAGQVIAHVKLRGEAQVVVEVEISWSPSSRTSASAKSSKLGSMSF